MSIYAHHMLARNALPGQQLTPFLQQMDDKEEKVLKKEDERMTASEKSKVYAATALITGAGAAAGGAVFGPVGAVVGGSAVALFPGAFSAYICCNDKRYNQQSLNEWRIHRLSDKISDIDSRMKSAASAEMLQLRKTRDYFNNNYKLFFRNIEVKHTHTHIHY